ncbi:MAG: ORF6N domain-containing protein [Muribaculaceae bacterium]|nr:ORF6N domain-containing protein [Muribaculaceae bacterium]
MPIENLIHIIRGQQTMLDSDLAKLYGVETRALNQAVKRNIERFPADFMFQLTKEEAGDLGSQIATSSSRSQNVILNVELENLKSQNVTSSSRSQIATLKQGHNIKFPHCGRHEVAWYEQNFYEIFSHKLFRLIPCTL